MEKSSTSAERVRRVVQLALDQPINDSHHATPLRRLGLDSASMIGLIAGLEAEFRIKILDEEIVPSRFESIAAISRYIENKLLT